MELSLLMYHSEKEIVVPDIVPIVFWQSEAMSFEVFGFHIAIILLCT